MKFIVDVDLAVRELNISSEVFAQWKAANLSNASASGDSAQWSALDESGILDHSYGISADLKIV